MHHSDAEIALHAAIRQLENNRNDQVDLLKSQIQQTYESLKPINMLKSTFRQANTSQDLQNALFHTSVGLAAGYLSKILFEGISNSPVKKLLGTALMFGITNVVAQNPAMVKALGKRVLSLFKSNRSDLSQSRKD